MDGEQLQQDLIAELQGILGQDFGLEDDLLYEGGLDSFGIMQLVAFIEESYGMRVPDDKLETGNFASARIIADWVLPIAREAGEGPGST